MICPSCDAQNPLNSRFCNHCGALLRSQDDTLTRSPERAFDHERELEIGSVFVERYTVIAELGRGGMGVVYKAEDKKLPRAVALKCLPAGMISRPEAKLRFRQEAQMASKLDHPNICTIYEIDETESGQIYIAMAFYEGQTLKARIAQGQLPVETALDLAIQIARGLEKAHSQGIVHRDIKPANVMLTDEGIVKILDFGLAKLMGPSQLTQTAAALGTTPYMSPEQAGAEDVDHRSDIWSFGVLFFELLTGTLPFQGENTLSVIYSIVHKSPIAPRELRETIPPSIELIVLKCLQKKREDRYQSVKALLSDLAKQKDALEAEKSAAPAEKSEALKTTERRQATVLCAEVVGYKGILETLSPEEASTFLNRCYGMLGSVIAQQGGRVEKISGGDLVAHFGIPQAVEDGPKKAVNAAIGMRQALLQLAQQGPVRAPLDLKIGIDTGTVITGGTGPLEYSALGPAVDLASQFAMAGEKGKIYVGQLTYRHTKNEFAYADMKMIRIKGIKEPAPVFELLSTKPKIYHRQFGPERMIQSEMVGREKELDKLRLHLLKAINHEGSIVNVIGEAGIGKSRLIAEFSQKEEMQKANVLKGQALSFGKNLSFHPIIDILKNWAGLGEEDSPSAAAQKIEQAIQRIYPERAADVYPFIATLMGIKLTDAYARRIKGIEGEALEKLILKSLRELLEKAAERKPLVVVIEDLHWADITTIEILESLYRLAERHSILFVNVFRPNYKETSERILNTIRTRYEGRHAEVVLEPLDGNECETLIENLLNVKEIPRDVKDVIFVKAEGNPFFIEEVARSFIDDGVVKIENGKFRLTEKVESVSIPATINEVIMARLDKLDEDTRSLLKLASVIGRNFFYSILAEVARKINEIDEKLDYLKEAQLISERKRMKELEYLFKHALARDTVYESILLNERKEIHLSVARSIEAVFKDRLCEFYGMLAFHYDLGDNPEKAEEYLIKAGEEALKSAASNEAIHFYGEALKLYRRKHGEAADPRKVANLERNIAIAYFNKGHMADSVEHFDRVLELWGERRPKTRIQAVMIFLFDMAYVLKNTYIGPKKKRKVPSEKDNEIFDILYKRSTALVTIETFRFLTDSVRLIKRLFEFDYVRIRNGAVMAQSSSVIFSFSGTSFKLSHKINTCFEYRAEEDDFKSILIYRYFKLVNNFLSGNWADVPGYDESLIDQNLRIGEFFTAPGYHIWMGLMAAEQGKFDLSEFCVRKLDKIGEEYENDYARSRKRLVNTKLLLKTRRLPEAIAVSEQEMAFQDMIGHNPLIALYVTGIKANAQILLGDMVEAGETLVKARAIIAGEHRILPYFISTFRIAQSLFDLEELRRRAPETRKSGRSQARKRSSRSVKMALKNCLKYATDQPESFRLLGTYFWLIGKRSRAFSWWNRSEKTAEKLGARPELARTSFEIGKRLSETGDDLRTVNGKTAAEYLNEAKIIFAELGLRTDLEELEKAEPQKS
jgi:class 3 adenylate cyclase/tetratricopeptide (TPR) repeat protein